MACDKCDKKNTNKGLECRLGYKHNPKTKESTINMLKNNGVAVHPDDKKTQRADRVQP